MNETKWGIIGPGKIAEDFANDLKLIDSPQRIISVLGHRRSSTNKFGEAFNVPGQYVDFSQFLKGEKPDVVYIASPHPHHFEQALGCLEQRIPVLCEKPLALNATQVNELIKVSKRNKTFLMEGMWIRFLPYMKKVLSLVAEGAIGNIISIKASIGYKAPDEPDSRYFDPDLGGGSLLDLGIYPVFLASILLGKPHNIKAVGTLTDQQVDESCSVVLEYGGGQHALLNSSLASQTDLPAEIAGEKGTIKILHPWFEKSKGVELQLYEKEKMVYPFEWEGHGLHFETKEVLDCIRDGKLESDFMPHDLSLVIVETMDEIRRQINVTYDKYEKRSDLTTIHE